MNERLIVKNGHWVAGVLFVLILLPWNVFASQPDGPMTMKQAVSLALKHNQDLKTAEDQVASYRITHDQDRSDFYPDLTARAGADVGRNTRSTPDDSTYRSLSAAITSTLNLFKGYEDQASYEKSRYALDSRKDSFERTRQAVIFNTVSAYLEAVLKKERIRVAEENLADNQKQLEQIEAFYKAGRRPVTDVYQQQAETANAKLTLLTAKEEWNTSKMKLLETIGISALTPVDLPGVKDVMVGNWAFADQAGLTASALEQRPDMKSKKSELKSTDMEIKEAESGHYPTVDLVFELSSSYTSLDDGRVNEQIGDDNLSASAGINVSIPIFDRHITRNNVSKARIASHTARVELEKLERQIEVEMGEAIANYQTASEQVEVSRSKLNYADKALESTRQRYKAGASTLTELTTAQSNYVEAQYDQVDADLKKVIKAMTISFYKGDMAEITAMVEK
ncbi:MAG: TolC family protein [Desulfobacteraceae bacterium]|jgi:outer membrane protein